MTEPTVLRTSGVRMPPDRVADLQKKLEIARCSLARSESEQLRLQQEFQETQRFWMGLCASTRREIEELESQLKAEFEKIDNWKEWPDDELIRRWENGNFKYELFKDEENARKLQLAYIATGSGAIFLSTVKRLSAEVAAGWYKNPKESPDWNPVRRMSSMSSTEPAEDAIFNHNMPEMVEGHKELSSTITAQNAGEDTSSTSSFLGKRVPESAKGISGIIPANISKDGDDQKPPMTKLSKDILAVSSVPRVMLQSASTQMPYPQLCELAQDASNAAKRIFGMTEKRPLELRQGKALNLDGLTHVYESHVFEASLGQSRGDLAPKPCGNCSKKIRPKGPFTKCVIVGGEFAGACCNCKYSGSETACTFYRRPKAELKGVVPPASASGAKSHFPKLRSAKSMPAEQLRKEHTESSGNLNINARVWAAYPRF